MASVLSEYEMEALPELELEFEGEGEWEFEAEGEYESEEFLRRIAGLARRAARSPALRRIGLGAARAALGGLGDLGGEIGGSTGRQMGSAIGGRIASWLPQSEYEFEMEGEYEGEFEGEYEVNPIRRVYADALMEHLGHAAAQAETEAEAEAFLGALIPMAARLIPRVAPAIMRAAPGLVRGVANIGRTLLRSPAARPLIRAVPNIVRRTTADLARQVSQGRPVTAQGAVRTLARQTAQVLSNPQQVTRALRRNQAVDRRFHRATRTPMRPRPVRAARTPALAGGCSCV